ncbi:MAG: hypothetical protein M0P57_11225 [Syntrophales bacterium]|jgi:phosphotransferase system enzyme I (PtsP)|nr:hypothetical protein [Syntrophales bacterium]MDY0044235.1 putative PEP-binding protein [Syntrophales bacterium]
MEKSGQHYLSMLCHISELSEVTSDGTGIDLMAHTNILGELSIERELKVDGTGLSQREFPFLVQSTFPSEEEQFRIYRRLFFEAGGSAVVIRTFDLAGNTIFPVTDHHVEAKSQPGLRSTRYPLKEKNIFDQQIRAILRAAAGHDKCAILFPLISSVNEFRRARHHVNECLSELSGQHIPHNRNPLTGAMIELSSTAGLVDEIAEEVDFAFIGISDLVRYMLINDRGNEQIEEYYQPFHPSVLRVLKKIAEAYISRNKIISVCGEQVHERDYLRFLLGTGFRNFSADPRFMPAMRRHIGDCQIAEAQCFADALLRQKTVADVHTEINDYLQLEYPPELSHGSCPAFGSK